MIDAYITYDAQRAREELKKELIKKGFLDYWESNNKTYYLPNTSLWFKNVANIETAERYFNEVVATINQKRGTNDKIEIDRFIVVSFNSWLGIQGKKHS